MEIDAETFKARRSWRQVSFWVALAPLVLALLPTPARDWIAEHWRALAAASGPLVAFLLREGVVRASSVRAYGQAVAAAAPEAARAQAVYGGGQVGDDEFATDEDVAEARQAHEDGEPAPPPTHMVEGDGAGPEGLA